MTTVINAIYQKTGKASVLYQIRNLIYAYKERQIADFSNTIIQSGTDLFHLDYTFVQQSEMRGIVVGGNISMSITANGSI